MGTFLRRLRARLKYRRHADDLARELDVHRAMAEDDLTTRGASRSDARRAAARLIGNGTIAREDARQVWVARWIDSVRQDLAYALRVLRRAPGVTAAAIAVLVAAMGLTTSLFAAFNAVLLRPWPVADAARVVSAFAGRGASPVVYGGWPAVEYRYLRERVTDADLVLMRDERLSLDFQGVGATSFVRVASDNYFRTLGIPVQLGRGFEPGDDEVDAPRAVLVLSDATWRAAYGARPSLVGDTVRLNNVPFQVVGIAAPGAIDNPLDPPPAAWVPFAAMQLVGGAKSQRDMLTSPVSCCQDLAARLAPGVTASALQSELAGLSRQFRDANGARFTGVRVSGTALIDTPRAGTATPIFGLLFAGVLLLLALACANVGNIVLARSMARVPELRVRLSLGAARTRVVRQLLTENLVLAAIAAALAMPIAYWLPGAILSAVSPLTAWGLDTRPDVRVFAFVVVIVAAAAAFFGLAPALRATRSATRLAAGARASADRGTARLRLGLLAGQIAIGSVLLVGSGLLGRAVARAADVPVGFDAADLNVVTAWLPASAYDQARARRLADQIVETAGTGANGAPMLAAIGRPMFEDGRVTTNVRRADEPQTAVRPAAVEAVSPSFFRVLGIGVVEGDAPDTALPETSLIINARLAESLWPGESAIGRTMIVGANQPRVVAAVVGNARLGAVDVDAPALFYTGAAFGAQDTPASTLTFVARDGASVEPALRAADSRIRVTSRPALAYLDDQLRPARVGALIAGALGVLAAVVSTIGVFGVFSYLVVSRRREIGIRLALGARAANAALSILRTAAMALSAGLLIGLAAALVFVPALSQYLYGLSPFDPPAFGGAVLLLSAAALAALIGPVRAVLRMNPAATLRAE